MSGRCDDGAAPFVVGHGWAGQPHADGHITATQTTALLGAFAVADISGKNGSKLKAKRQAYNAAFAHSANVATVRSTLHRLVILERLDEAQLVSRRAQRLRRDHRIPDDRIDDLLHRLRAAVKSWRADIGLTGFWPGNSQARGRVAHHQSRNSSSSCGESIT